MNTKRARELRKNLTDAEQQLWRILKRHQVAGVFPASTADWILHRGLRLPSVDTLHATVEALAQSA